MSIQRTI